MLNEIDRRVEILDTLNLEVVAVPKNIIRDPNYWALKPCGKDINSYKKIHEFPALYKETDNWNGGRYTFEIQVNSALLQLDIPQQQAVVKFLREKARMAKKYPRFVIEVASEDEHKKIERTWYFTS